MDRSTVLGSTPDSEESGASTGKTERNPRGGWGLTDSLEQAINFVVFA